MERHAFQLAEQYRDFQALVELCHSVPPIYPPSSNTYVNYVHSYIERYKEEFTDQLYSWYIKHSRLSLSAQLLS